MEALTAEKTALEQRENDDFTSSRIVEINKELKLLENNRKVESLLARENDELFLADLAAIHAELAKLKSIEINWDNVKLARFDQLAVTPRSAIKPKKSLIVAMGALLGGMLGVFIALIKAAIRKRKLQLA
ncbi:GNVR domain-containing protein [Thiopseudomonas alkaliphila]|uniref:GNVR domain-containing protein n=1 Tax=Thiopseudomonas alkaliphila TaxID=1697053 RepID=UPI00069FAC4A|nr:GNVR domain-containing protein [Thiopseudomonas alkaliphila]